MDAICDIDFLSLLSNRNHFNFLRYSRKFNNLCVLSNENNPESKYNVAPLLGQVWHSDNCNALSQELNLLAWAQIRRGVLFQTRARSGPSYEKSPLSAIKQTYF